MTVALIAVSAFAFVLLVIIVAQKNRYYETIERVSRNCCWYSDCILNAGHDGLHKD